MAYVGYDPFAPFASGPGGTVTVPGAPTRLDMIRRLLALLGETGDSPLAQVDGGSGDAAAITADDQANNYLWQAARFYCRACWPVEATASKTGAGTVRIDRLTATVSGSPVAGSVLWAVHDVLLGTTPLGRMGPNQLAVKYKPNAAGTPTHWAKMGDGETIRIAPSSSASVTFYGYALPNKLEEDESTWSPFFPPDIALDVLPAGAAAMVALQNLDDERLQARRAECLTLFNGSILEQFSRLDPYVRAAHFGASPNLLGILLKK